jgi:hypothetical protein
MLTNSVRCKLSLFMQRITTSWLLLLTIHGASTISLLVYAWLRSSPPLCFFVCALLRVSCTHSQESFSIFFLICELCMKIDCRHIKCQNILIYLLIWDFHFYDWSLCSI